MAMFNCQGELLYTRYMMGFHNGIILSLPCMKDAIIVIAGCALFGDPISLEQGFGFAAQLFFIFLWSIMSLGWRHLLNFVMVR